MPKSPSRNRKCDEYEKFKALKNYYITEVVLGRNQVKLYRNIKPMKVEAVKIDTDPDSWTYNNIVKFVGTSSNGKKKTLVAHNYRHYFLKLDDACNWYDERIAEAQITIKKNINILIEKYNTLEDEKINIRSKKLERLCND